MEETPALGSLSVLSRKDLERIHTASISLLQEQGVLSKSELILDIFEAGGARVDRKSRLIRLRPGMVEGALESAPRSFILHGRDPQYDLLLEPGRMYFCMGGTSEPQIWDYDLGVPRSPNKSDMVACTRLGQALRNVDIIMSLCSAGDVPAEQIYLHEYDAILRHTTKPVIYGAPGRWYATKLFEMAAAICGGLDELRRRPFVMLFVLSVSPLAVGPYSEGMIEAAELGVPILSGTGPMMGATTPVTLAGHLAQTNAEALFGIVMAQLIKPGTPVVYGPHAAVMDMATAQCTYGSPEQSLARAALAQLGRFYDLPSFGLGGGVEAKLPDAEAAAQAMMGILLNALTGLTLTQCLGTMASGMYGAQEMLLICDEMVHMVKRIMAGIVVDDETLALDLIREVAPGGEFLSHPHTARQFRRELFFPVLFRRQSIDQWLEAGARPIVDLAHERARSILEEAGPVPLPYGADAELERVLHNAIGELHAR